MNRGVIIYNTGRRCLVRLLVALYTLRKHFSGPVTILSEGRDSHDLCRRIGRALDVDVKDWDCGIPEGPNRVYLVKTRFHAGSPYEVTIALDADILVLGSIDDLFDEAAEHDFCVARFADWKSSEGIIAQRLLRWQPWFPIDVQAALNFGPAINVGVIAFRRDSSLCNAWLNVALHGRHTFIPEEVSCQLILHRYRHRIVDRMWNCSCKYDDPNISNTRIVHFHGNKHCRLGLPFHGELWIRNLEEVLSKNLAGLIDWLPAEDCTLDVFLTSILGTEKGAVGEMQLDKLKCLRAD